MHKMIDHNRMYSAALTTLGLMAAISSGLLLFLTGVSMGGSVNTHLPDFSLPWIGAINFGYATAILIVLCARRFKPGSGQRLTRLLNWALLPALPGGTIVGIYGMLKVDKQSGADRIIME
jgi:hypothetical protein